MKDQKEALNTGITGQDGAYLAEVLKTAQRDELIKEHGFAPMNYHE